MRRYLLACALISSAVLAACGSRSATLPVPGGPAFLSEALAPRTGATVIWKQIGPREPAPGIPWWWNPSHTGNSGKTNAIVVNPKNPNIMYLAGGVGRGCEVTSQAGIYKTLDGGLSWTPADVGLTDTYVNDLWIDPVKPVRLVAATEKGGLFYSNNGGVSWTSAYPGVTARMVAQIGKTLYAATSIGVLTSTTGGQSWQLALPTFFHVNAIGGGNGVVYAGTANGQTYELAGGKWSQGGSVPVECQSFSGVREFAADPLQPSTAYLANNAYIGGADGGRLYVTTNKGASWQKVPFPVWMHSSQGSQTIAFSRKTPHLLYVAGDEVAATFDGKNWNQMLNPNRCKVTTDLCHAGDVFGDTRRLYVLPAGGGERILMNSDQGAWSAASFDGTGIVSLTAGLSSNVVTDVAVRGSVVAVTIQDFIAMQTQRPNARWGYNIPYENGSVAIGYGANANDCVVADAGYYGFSSDGCRSFKRTYRSPAPWSENPGQVVFDPVSTAAMYAIGASGHVYASNNGGQTYFPTSWPLGASWLAIDPENDQNIYAIDSSGDVEYTHDGGTTWLSGRNGCNGRLTVVAVDPVDSNDVVTACNDVSGAEIYASVDAGAHFSNVAEPVRSDLRARRSDYSVLYRSLLDRSIPMQYNASTAYFGYPYDLEFNPAPPAGQTPALVLATSLGGAISYDGGTTWASIDGNAIGTQWWRVGWSGGRVFVATRGQGVLMAPLQPSN